MAKISLTQYDPAAIYEAVVSAVAHRDYSIRGAKIRLRMFSDRIELCSPGMLMDGMTVADLPYKQQARNPSSPTCWIAVRFPKDSKRRD